LGRTDRAKASRSVAICARIGTDCSRRTAWRASVDKSAAALRLVEPLNESDHQRRADVGLERVDKAATGVRPATDLPNASGRKQRVVARVRIGLQIAGEVGEDRLGAGARAGFRRVKDDLRSEPIEVGPEPPRPAADAIVENGDRRIVGVQVRRGDDLATQLHADRRQRGRDIGDPAAQRGARQIDAFAQEDARLGDVRASGQVNLFGLNPPVGRSHGPGID
jgi:hypothetical protein